MKKKQIVNLVHKIGLGFCLSYAFWLLAQLTIFA